MMSCEEVDELQGRVSVVCGQLNVAHARLIDLIIEATDADAWRQPGLHSVEQWAHWQMGVSWERARHLVTIAQRRDDLPVSFEAFRNGELAIDQMLQIARYAAPHNDAEVCYLATQTTVQQLRSAMSRHRPSWNAPAPAPPTADPTDDRTSDDHGEQNGHPSDDRTSDGQGSDDHGSDGHGSDGAPSDGGSADGAAGSEDVRTATSDGSGAGDSPDSSEARTRSADRVAMFFDDDGRYQLHANCPTEVGALIDAALREARDALIGAGGTNVSWMDALAEVCNRSLAGIRSTSRADRYRVYIHLDATQLVRKRAEARTPAPSARPAPAAPPSQDDHTSNSPDDAPARCSADRDPARDDVSSTDPSDDVEARHTVATDDQMADDRTGDDRTSGAAEPRYGPTTPSDPASAAGGRGGERSAWSTCPSHGEPLSAWLNAGPGLDSETRDYLCCDAIIQPLYVLDTKPVNIGRASHVVPAHLRRLILDRDRHCRFPGCTSTLHLDVHHLIHWIRSGPTDTFNLAALCTRHHTSLHRGEFSADGNADVRAGIVWRRANGSIIVNNAIPVPPAGPLPEPPDSHHYEHPLGERFVTKYWQLNDSPEDRHRHAATMADFHRRQATCENAA